MVDLSSYQDLFIQTAQSYLEKIKSNLDIFLKNAKNKEVVSDLHISVHAIKGQSYVMGYQTLGDMCKELEYIFRAIKEDRLALNPELSKTIKESVQKIDASLQQIKKTHQEENLNQLKNKLEQLSGISI
jgi:chemotaxis protein histidine kinase CheA